MTPNLRDAARGGTAGRARARLQSWLVGGEVALSLTLLVAAGLLFQTFLRLTSVDVGVDASSTITASVALPASRYEDGAARASAYRRLVRTLGDNPAIRAAGFIYDVPLSADRQGTSITVRGEAEAVLTRAADVPPGGPLDIEFADGHVAATAAGEAPRSRKRRSPKGGPEEQGSLF